MVEVVVFTDAYYFSASAGWFFMWFDIEKAIPEMPITPREPRVVFVYWVISVPSCWPDVHDSEQVCASRKVSIVCEDWWLRFL